MALDGWLCVCDQYKGNTYLNLSESDKPEIASKTPRRWQVMTWPSSEVGKTC